MIRIVVCAALLFFAGVAGTSAAADPILSFEVSADTLGEGDDLSGQLSLEVLFLDASDQVSFTFTNDVASGSASSITDIYFRRGDTKSGNTIIPGIGFEDYMEEPASGFVTASAGVSFSSGASPANPPGGIAWAAVFSADSESGSGGIAANGVDATGEWVTLTFNLLGSNETERDASWAAVLSLLDGSTEADSFIALHVQAIAPNGKSATYFNVPGVPEPVTIVLFGAGMVGLAGARRRWRSRA